MNELMGRRELVGAAAAIGGGILLLGPTALTAGADSLPRWTRARSANGWPVLGRASLTPVEGTGLELALAGGVVTTVLHHLVRRYFYEIDSALEPGDVGAFTSRRAYSQRYESNLFSGTAVAIRPDYYPVGLAGGFFPPAEATVRDILAELDGVVKWGADMAVPKESHFQIDVQPNDARLLNVAGKLRGWHARGDRGAGRFVDPYSKTRRQRARTLEQAQRK